MTKKKAIPMTDAATPRSRKSSETCGTRRTAEAIKTATSYFACASFVTTLATLSSIWFQPSS